MVHERERFPAELFAVRQVSGRFSTSPGQEVAKSPK